MGETDEKEELIMVNAYFLYDSSRMAKANALSLLKSLPPREEQTTQEQKDLYISAFILLRAAEAYLEKHERFRKGLTNS